MGFKRCLLVLFVYAFIVVDLSSQTIPQNFRFYNSTHGFNFDKVNQIEQDTFGFLWMATNEGLTKFDGTNFQTFEHLSNLKSLQGSILCELKDKKQNFWFGTNNGLIFYDIKTGIFKEIQLAVNKVNYIYAISIDINGNIWVSSGNGLFKIDNSKEIKKAVQINNKYNCHVVSGFRNSVWHIGFRYIFQYDVTSNRLIDSVQYSQDFNYFNNIQTATAIDARGNIWIGKYNGEIYQFNPLTKQTKLFDMKMITSNPSSLINNIYVHDDSKVYIVVDEAGVWVFDMFLNTFKPFVAPNTTKKMLPSYKITSMFLDREQNYWFGLTKNGIAFTNKSLSFFSKLDLSKYSNNQSIPAICRDHSGKLWLGTDGGGMLLFDVNNNYVRSFTQIPGIQNSLSNNAVLSIFEDSKRRIWTGTFRGGLSLLNTNNYTFKHFTHQENIPNSLPRNDIRKIVEDKNGHLWLAVHGTGISKFNPENESFVNFNSLSNPWVYDLIIARDQTVWASCVKGIGRMKKGEKVFTNFYSTNIENTELADDFSCLFEDYEGTIWVGSVHGLHQFSAKTNSINPFKINPLIDNASIKAITEDKNHNLYISTNKGLFRIDAKKQNIIHFGQENGLISDLFNLNSIFKQKDSILYLGTSKGLVWFNTNSVQTISMLPQPVITDIKIFGESVMPWSTNPYLENQASYLSELQFDYDQNHLTFDIACPFFQGGISNSSFQYQLVGLEKNWQNCGLNRSITYSSLPPGNYTLKLRAISKEWQSIYSKELNLRIVINPPFWATWWFKLLFVLVLILGFWQFLKYKTREINKLNKILEEKIAERTFEIAQKNIRLEEQRAELELANSSKNKLFSIIGHDLRAPFSSILAFGDVIQKSKQSGQAINEKEIVHHIVSAAKNAYSMLENLLQWARTQTGRISFRASKVEMKSFVQTIIDSVNFSAKDKNISIKLMIENSFYAFIDKDMFETMVRNLLNNSLKFTYTNGEIVVTIKTLYAGFEISVSDNGIGMSSEQIDRILHQGKVGSTYGTNGESGTGIGLLVCREFLDFHMGSWEINSQEGVGTTFNLNIPCEIEVVDELKVVYNSIIENIQPNLELISKSEIDLIRGKKVLVVEDNEQIRKAVVMQLSDTFLIVEAENGLEGYNFAKEKMPDLIISDVIMPQMNGIEFSKKLKHDISTSHIPIILLTSMNEEMDVIAGLQTGVDDYMLKPFNANILFLKICKLLINRENLKKKFTLDDSKLLDSIAENSNDQQLIKMAFQIIDDNLSDEDFSVELLSSKIGMHRSNLSRKITSLTGTSPQELIKIRRMKLAAKLLLASGKNVSEVAYQTGFSDPKYFSRVFKSYFGVLPSEYVN